MAEDYVGDAFVRIGTPIENEQGGYQIIALDNGNFVAVWSDNSDGVGDGSGNPADDYSQKAVRAQLFGADGNPLGTPFLANSTKPYDQFAPVVAALPGGGFAVAWETQSWQDGINALFTGIDAQVFDQFGEKVGTEIEILPAQSDDFLGVEIVATTGGGFAVAWNDFAEAGDDLDGSVHIRFVDGSLTPDSIRLVNTETHDLQWVKSITALADGAVVVVWQDESAGLGTVSDDSSGFAIRGQLFDVDGDKVGAEFLINSATHNDQHKPTVISLAGGGFAVVWQDLSLGNGGASGDPAGQAIKAQVYDAGANAVGSEVLVNTAFVDDQEVVERGTAAALPDGGFVVVWVDWSEGTGGASGDNSDTAIKAQIFNANGSKRGGEILVNTTIAGFQNGATVAALDDGGFVIGWSNGAGGTFEREINAQVFTANGTKIGSELHANIGTAYDGDVALVPVPGGGFAISYRTVLNDELYIRTFTPNDAPELTGPATLEIKEGQAAVATISATDPNGHDLDYQIVGGADELLFGIDAVTGALAFLNAPDFEDATDANGDNVYELRVAATDTGGLFDEATLSVVVTNVDEKPTDVTLSKTSIAENRNAGATVGTLSIVDQDGPGASFALTSNPGGFFRVVGDKLQTARRLNFEKNKTHTITVEATDTGGATVSNSFTIKVADLVDLITGNDRNNTLKGANGADDLRGLGGSDKLFGNGGKDVLDGGGGNDLLIGGGGGDRLNGGKGKDTASYQEATKEVVANLKNPKKNKGEAAGDSYGGVENLTGGTKSDVLTGSNGANVIKGLSGNDRLVGGKGADHLEGGFGKDVLTGGGQGDLFVFRTLQDSPAGRKKWDVIADFKRKHGDLIDLSAIDARTGKKNHAFAFIGDSAFTGAKGELRFDKLAKKTFVYGDVTGDSKADFRIELSKAIDLVKADFVV